MIPRCLRPYPYNKVLHGSVADIFENIFTFSTKAKHVFRIRRNRTSGKLSMNVVVSLTAATRLLWNPFEVKFGQMKKNVAKSVAATETEAELAGKEPTHEKRTKDDIR
jgi:hypothetical protein